MEELYPKDADKQSRRQYGIPAPLGAIALKDPSSFIGDEAELNYTLSDGQPVTTTIDNRADINRLIMNQKFKAIMQTEK